MDFMGKNKTEKKSFAKRGMGRWIGTRNVSSATDSLKSIFSGLFQPTKKEFTKETFEQAVERLGLDEKKIQAIAKNLLIRLKLYLVCTALAVLYLIYLLFVDQIAAALLMLIITFILLAYSFKEHFQYIQVKNRYLGYTLSQWLKITLRGGNAS